MSTPLATYMKEERITDAEIAVMIGKDRTLVSKIRRGLVRPTLDVAAEIETKTRGLVPMQAWTSIFPDELRA